MSYYKILFSFLIFLGFQSVNAQMIADFETTETTPTFIAEGATSIVDNPDKTGINSSSKVGFYNKIAGNWHYVTMNFATPVKIGYNNTLTFKIRASQQGRIFAKFWIGEKVLIESWAPEYAFQPLPNTWTECKMDLTLAMGKEFTKLELAACVDNLEVADVYFDDVLLSNPDASDGTPKPSFLASKTKIGEGDEVTFDASASFDYDGAITNFSWDFGDNTTAIGKIVTHTFTNDGNFKVVLTVTDNDAKSSSENKYIFVLDATKTIGELTFVNPTPKTNDKIEAIFQINRFYNNVYNPDEVSVDAEIQYPDGSKIVMPCFYYIHVNLENTTWIIDSTYQTWMLRFTSEQIGLHAVKLTLKDAEGLTISETYSVEVTSGTSKGIVRNDAQNNQYYRHTTGEVFNPLGINIGWAGISDYTKIINNLSTGKANTFRYWQTPFAQQALEWKPTTFYNGLGVYSQEAAAMSDNLLNLSETKNMFVQLTIFQHGMFSENVDPMWVDNPYNSANGGYVARAEEYFYNDACKAQTKKLLRYIVARWAYSKNLFAWEFFNEVQFTGIHNEQTSKWFPGVLTWHSEMSQYIQSIDPFNHIMTTVAEHNQIPFFDSISALDNIQYHLYSNNLLNDQVKLDNQFSNGLENLSIINGEYGTNVEAETPFDMQRNAIWIGIMTQVPRYMWIWAHYLELSWAQLFTMPADYLKDEDFATSEVLNSYYFEVDHDSKVLSSQGLSSDKNFYGYIFDPLNSDDISGVICKLKNIPPANYTVTYYLPVSNVIVKVDSLPLIKLTNALELPQFSKGIAFKIKYLSKYTLPIAIAGNDTVVAPGLSVSFSGEQSFNQVTGTTLTYLWKIDSKPANSNLSISNPTAESITIIPDVSGIYKISLVVNDGFSSSIPDVVTITVSNPPVANAGSDAIANIDDNYYFLDGTGSYDSDGDALTYLWKLAKYPTGSRGNLLDFKKPNAILSIDELGEYLAVLVVNDGISNSQPDTVKIDVVLTDINQSTFSNFTIYPNPTNGNITINSNGNIHWVEIFDISGRKLLTINANNKKELAVNILDITRGKGVFIVKISDEYKAVFKKVIVN